MRESGKDLHEDRADPWLGSFLLAFSVRAGVNVLLLVFRTYRRRQLQLQVLRHAIFGAEPFRFGAMIGASR